MPENIVINSDEETRLRAELENKTDAEEKIRKNNVTLEGIIKPYGKIINRIATHKLIAPKNKIYLLYGNKAALDALNYHKVKIVGKFIDAPREKYPVVEISMLIKLE